jgi:hypothetical protein
VWFGRCESRTQFTSKLKPAFKSLDKGFRCCRNYNLRYGHASPFFLEKEWFRHLWTICRHLHSQELSNFLERGLRELLKCLHRHSKTKFDPVQAALCYLAPVTQSYDAARALLQIRSRKSCIVCLASYQSLDILVSSLGTCDHLNPWTLLQV